MKDQLLHQSSWSTCTLWHVRHAL